MLSAGNLTNALLAIAAWLIVGTVFGAAMIGGALRLTRKGSERASSKAGRGEAGAKASPLGTHCHSDTLAQDVGTPL